MAKTNSCSWHVCVIPVIFFAGEVTKMRRKSSVDWSVLFGQKAKMPLQRGKY